MSESVGELTATLSANTAPFTQAFNAAGNSAHESLTKSMVTAQLVSSGIEKAFDAITDSVKETFKHMGELGAANRQTAAVLKSTGEAAGVSAEGVSGLAEHLERITGVEKTAVQSGENLLLTFTNVKNGVGAGNDIFNQATSTILDMSQALGQDTKSSAIQLGKALNDPIQGMTALKRVGVTFTDSQKEQITTLEKSGNLLGAQKLILAELSKEFGGSAEAATKGMGGALKRLDQGFMDLKVTILGGASPALAGFANTGAELMWKLADAVKAGGVGEAIREMIPPGFQMVILGVAGAITASLIPGLTTMAAEAYVAAAGMLAALAPLAPFVIAGGAVGAVAFVIMQNWVPISGFFSNIFNNISGGIGTLYNNFKGAFGGIGTIVEAVANFVKEKFGWLVSLLPASMKNAISGAGAALAGLPSFAVKSFTQTAKAAGEGGKKIKEAFGAGLGKLSIPNPDMGALVKATKPPRAPKAAKISTGFDVKADISSTLAEYPAKLKAIDEQAKMLGPSFDAAGAKASLLKGDLVHLADDGVKNSDTAIKGLKESYLHWQSVADSAGTTAKTQVSEMDKVSKALASIAQESDIMGDTAGGSAKQIAYVKSEMDRLAKSGKGTAEDIAYLGNTLKDLQSKTDAQAITDYKLALSGMDYEIQGMSSSVNDVAEGFGTKLPDSITKPIDSMGKLTNGFEGIGQIGSQMIPNLATLFGGLAGVMAPVVAAAWSFTAAMLANPIGMIVVGVTGLIVGVGLLAKNWTAVTKAISDSIGAIGGLLQGMASAVGSAFGAIIKGVGDAFKGIFDFFVDMIKNFINATVIGPIDFVIGGLDMIPGVHIPKIPMLAEGGVATKPTMAMIGEGSSQEAILPLNENTFDRLGTAIAGAMRGNGQQAQGGQNTTINVYTLAYTGDQASLQELARLIGIQQNQMSLRRA